ncbi:mitochondrial carrier [Annulohypoxylon truncatum]|uniref:mitochondrial carrier n=1 Tax=Annulohypoxylon truncatum TaxID=327061 RepID=UPI0020077C33|nr:mitochondrial carrier [Annulohypoxylon truncatum]KAI1214860.1 mitochondrial carrier [Annulohypoxylon truncatum]
MTQNHAGLSPASVETIAGLSAGSIATLVVHPLDIVKTRMQIHQRATSHPLTTLSLIRTLTQTPHPIASLYRGLAPNLLGNASSWASFFFFKAWTERALLSLKPSAPTAAAADGSPSAPAASLSARDYFLASGAAGVVTQVLTNPLWVLKTRMLSSDRGSAGAYPDLRSGAARLFRDEGWRGFYRGLGISLFGVAHGAVQFAVYDPLKRLYFSRRATSSSSSASASHRSSRRRSDVESSRDQQQRISNEATLVLSSVAKLVAGAVTYPYQVIRSRLQNYDADARFGRGIRGVVGRTWREEGWRGFYRGIIPGVVRVLPATWVTFLVYENMKFYLPRWTG